MYLELLRRGYKIWTGAFRNGEIDFTVKNRDGEIEYYQIWWEISTTLTANREFAPFECFVMNYGYYCYLYSNLNAGITLILYESIIIKSD